MTQFARPTLAAATDDGITLSTKSNGAWTALYTNHAGAAAPPSPEKGQGWVDTSLETDAVPRLLMKQYTGTVWRTLGTLDLTTGLYTTAGGLPLTGGTVTGPILFPSGAAAAPGVSFAGDTDTGMFRVAADQIGFSTLGVQRLAFNAATLDTVIPTINQSAVSPAFNLSRSSGASGAGVIRFQTGASSRWAINVSGTESTGNAGSSFFLQSFDDAGALLVNYLTITRNTRQMGINGAQVGNSTLAVRTPATSGVEDAVSLLNVNTGSDAGVRQLFSTGAGSVRAVIQGGREGATSNGYLQFRTMLGTTEVPVLHLAADQTVTAHGSVANPDAILGPEQGHGLRVIRSFTDGVTFKQQRAVTSAGFDGLGFAFDWVHATGAYIASRINTNGVLFDFRHDGNAYAPGSWVPGSDSRLKSEQTPLGDVRAIIMGLVPKSYIMHGTKRYGLIAQETQTFLPDVVVDTKMPVASDPDGPTMLGMDYNGVLVVLLRHVQNLETRLAALEEK